MRPHLEHYPGPQAGAVLDIGGRVGAVVVDVGEGLPGQEIWLYQPDGVPVMHTEVHRREVPGRTVLAGLFPAVPAGDYRVDVGGAEPVAVSVRGGEVSAVIA